MSARPEIITLGTSTPASSYLVADLVNPRNIYADEGVVAGAAFVGMMAFGVSAAFMADTSTGGFMIAILQGMLGMCIGGLVFGAIGFIYSYPQNLREEIQKLNIDTKQVSWLSAFKMIAWIRAKKTIVSLGTDRLGNKVQAYVTSRFGYVTLSQVIAPKPIESWDKSAESVANVYGLTKDTKQEVNA